MKIKQLITGLFILFTLLLSLSFTAIASQGNAHIDGVDKKAISGWAWNESNPNSVVTVKVEIISQSTGKIVKTCKTTAETYRDDLAKDGIGTGKYGFTTYVDWSSLDSAPYIIKAYANGVEFPNALAYHEDGSYHDATSTSSTTVYGTDGVSLGVFTTTAYCPCSSCSEGWGRQTSTGAIATANHTIAVDPSVIPYGTQVMINGITYTAEDRGGGVHGNHIDIFFNNHSETYAYGKRSVEVFLIS